MISRPWQVHGDFFQHPPLGQRYDPVGQKNGFANVMGDEDDRGPLLLPYPRQFFLRASFVSGHPRSRKAHPSTARPVHLPALAPRQRAAACRPTVRWDNARPPRSALRAPDIHARSSRARPCGRPASSARTRRFRALSATGTMQTTENTTPRSGPRPLNRTCRRPESPPRGGMKPAIMLRIVVLPQPEGPTMEINSPVHLQSTRRALR